VDIHHAYLFDARKNKSVAGCRRSASLATINQFWVAEQLGFAQSAAGYKK